VATDTMKNTVNALAKEHLGGEIEWLVSRRQHFVKKIQASAAGNDSFVERPWQRFVGGWQATRTTRLWQRTGTAFAQVVCTRKKQTVESGIDELLILKSTASGFENFPRCEYTTLPETKDRIMATSMKATWKFAKPPRIIPLPISVYWTRCSKNFARNYSPSVQTTLFENGGSCVEENARDFRNQFEAAQQALPVNQSRAVRPRK